MGLPPAQLTTRPTHPKSPTARSRGRRAGCCGAWTPPNPDRRRRSRRTTVPPALEVLADGDAQIAADVLAGIERTDARERSSIFSAAAGVLSTYNSDAARQTAARPNFDPVCFAASTDTIYITSPEHHQAALAPLIVGLLEQIRHGAYKQARADQAPDPGPGMLWLLAVPTHSDTVGYQTQRQRVLTPGDIAKLPDGHGLLLQGAAWELIALARWYENQPWRRAAGSDGSTQ